jgi:hypothetical protein
MIPDFAGQKGFKTKDEKKRERRRSQRKEKIGARKVCNFAIFIQFINNCLTFRKVGYKY